MYESSPKNYHNLLARDCMLEAATYVVAQSPGATYKYIHGWLDRVHEVSICPTVGDPTVIYSSRDLDNPLWGHGSLTLSKRKGEKYISKTIDDGERYMLPQKIQADGKVEKFIKTLPVKGANECNLLLSIGEIFALEVLKTVLPHTEDLEKTAAGIAMKNTRKIQKKFNLLLD